MDSVYAGNYWESIPNRRKFLDAYAREHLFDPLLAANWYSVVDENLKVNST